jgi:uncharacterized RDD family membrane protein YckC
MSQLVINTSFNIDLGFELAPLHKRIFATLVDYFLLLLYLYIIINAVFDQVRQIENDGLELLVSLLLVAPAYLYFFYMEILMNGQTIGKRLFNLKVISLDGNKPSNSQLALRWFLRTIDFSFSFFLVGLISSAVTKNGQRIGDLAAGTTVVSDKLPYNIDNTIFKRVSEDYNVQFAEVMKLSDRDINTINNVLNQHYKSSMNNYVVSIAEKIKTVLNIQTSMHAVDFLETLLNDYNYLSQNK